MYPNHSPSFKVGAEHRQRWACVYVRQSTVFQVMHHFEGTERQYHLRQRAQELGWAPEAIQVIDEDQGRSAASAAHRQGFQHLVAAVAAGEVGLVLMLEASRLARCGADWHRLIELCSLTHTLIADEQAVYDPREPNDRLLLGVKGTLSEAELMALRTRLYEGRWNKARPDGRWVKDPDRHVQQRLSYVFALFRQLGVARHVLLRLQAEQLKLPARHLGGPGHGQLVWTAPSYGAVMRIVRNPGYAGVYVYGECCYEGTGRYPKRRQSAAAVPPAGGVAGVHPQSPSRAISPGTRTWRIGSAYTRTGSGPRRRAHRARGRLCYKGWFGVVTVVPKWASIAMRSATDAARVTFVSTPISKALPISASP